MTGSELQRAVGGPSFVLWKACLLAPDLAVRVIGRRYVRLDVKVEGYERLSPSILREFLTYTVVGRAEDADAVEDRATELAAHIRLVSRRKLLTARRVVEETTRQALADPRLARHFCAVVAGDIVYEMSHEVSRPERSTGVMVSGSDLDIVLLVGDDAPPDLAAGLDAAVYAKKYAYLRNPAFREEIDYIVKPLAKLREQTAFDSFHHMVACKIFDECVFVAGSTALFDTGKQLLVDSGVVAKLRAMEERATAARALSQEYLLSTDDEELREADLSLFYTAEESEEFE